MTSLIEDLKEPDNLAHFEHFLTSKGIPFVRIPLETFEVNDLNNVKIHGYTLHGMASLSLDRHVLLLSKNGEFYIGYAILNIPSDYYTVTVWYKVLK